MSDGIKAMYEEESELASNLEQLGLDGDKIWDLRRKGRPLWWTRTINDCAARNLTLEATIKELHRAKHECIAEREAREEINERKIVKSLIDKYGKRN